MSEDEAPGFFDETQPLALDDLPETMRLVVIGKDENLSVPLPSSGGLTVGRAETNDLQLDDASVSRQHLRLRVGADGAAPLTAEDLGSQNGIRMRGQRIPVGTPIPFGINEPLQVGAVVLVVTGRAPVDVSPSAPVVVDPQMHAIYETVQKIAGSELSVLILGETGVGKELVAEAVHRHSRHREGPFLRMNCGAIAQSLVESELFGHVRGAFTGADRDRPGLFEAAEHGTLFLDEVGELSPAIQVKLLRVLEQSMVTRVGDVQPRPVRCRIVAATNRDLADGGFRRDLYFRLNGVSIEVPALRERPSEIRPLGEHFIRDSVRRHGARPPASVEPEFWTALEAHSWPGNVRELRNVVERAVVLADGGSLDRSKLPADQAPNRPTEATLPPLKSEVEELERRRIMDALAQCSGNQTRAATLLGISRRTLINRLDTYKVPRPRKR